VLNNNQESILGPTDCVGVGELKRRGKRLHFVGNAITVAIGDRPDGGLARTYKKHVGGRRNRHVAGVRNDRKKFNLKTWG